ncbi:MAG: hypothetical protein R3C02_02575 [Planctomycetaceae bacterium]
MSDLYLGIAILVALMIASFLLAAWLTRKSSTVTCDVGCDLGHLYRRVCLLDLGRYVDGTSLSVFESDYPQQLVSQAGFLAGWSGSG